MKGDSFCPCLTCALPGMEGEEYKFQLLSVGGDVEVFLNSVKSTYQAAFVLSVLKMVIKFCCMFYARS